MALRLFLWANVACWGWLLWLDYQFLGFVCFDALLLRLPCGFCILVAGGFLGRLAGWYNILLCISMICLRR